jgi:gingipain R
MKKTILSFFILCLALTTMAQEWTSITSSTPATFKTQLVSSSEDQIQVKVQVPGFYATAVATPRGEAYVITMPKAVSTAQAGEPNVPMTGIPAIIGDRARMDIRVVNAKYQDFEGIEVAPSKGDFPRSIDPATVPYTYGECYSQDAFFPASNVGMYDPYIIRDFRGQNMVVYPFAYNPVTKTLRVYYDMTVEMYKLDDNGENVMETRRSNVVKLDPDFKSMYQRHFINYEAGMAKYTPLEETGDLLIICYDNFISSMTDFVNWKKTRGINTTIVGTSTISSSLTYSNLKTYIQSQYNANNNLTHVLLVGDVAQIPGYSYSGGGSDYSGLGDNAYGQVVGSDIYNDVIIGRFSASNATRVTTQCNRVITYERDLTTSASWLQKGVGISRKENGAGHNNEDDYQHMNNIRTDLLNYGYTTVTQRYANLTGYDASASTISSDINSGAGIVNYANHGQETAWGANYSGYVYYANSHVNALTNENKLPFIFSVACLVGKYDHSSDCFAEAWMNATNNNNPTGAIGTLMSYIEQPWIPPMWAQDECIDILVGNSSTSTSQKYTYGGVCINGLMGIFNHYSTSEQSAVGTYQSWIVFGDPSLMVRTKTPQAMTVTHAGTIQTNATTYTVNVTNGNGSVATITDANHNILGKATVSNNTATITINGTPTAGQTLTLCVFGYNKVTNIQEITVANPAVAPTVTTTAVSNIDKTTATGGGNVTADGGATVTARGICWSTSQNPTVSDSHTTDGTGTGSFTSAMTGLTASTTYYVRAYATNSAGTTYGEEVSFTTLPDGIPGDVDGDGMLTINDVSVLLGHLLGESQLTGQALQNADVDGDNEISINDVSVLLMTVMNQ